MNVAIEDNILIYGVVYGGLDINGTKTKNNEVIVS
jgi:hypothetical protein